MRARFPYCLYIIYIRCRPKHGNQMGRPCTGEWPCVEGHLLLFNQDKGKGFFDNAQEAGRFSFGKLRKKCYGAVSRCRRMWIVWATEAQFYPKSVIRPTIGLDYLFLCCLFICFGVLFAVFLPVSSRPLCLRRHGRNTTNITSKTFMNSNDDRFGIKISPGGHEYKSRQTCIRISGGRELYPHWS